MNNPIFRIRLDDGTNWGVVTFSGVHLDNDQLDSAMLFMLRNGVILDNRVAIPARRIHSIEIAA